MRGLAPLIALRRGGSVPDCVWVDLERDPMPMAEDWAGINNRSAHVQLEPEDRIRHLDLRCAKGLPCYVQGNDRDEVRAMRDACLAAGASRVIATVMRRVGQGEFVAFHVEEMTDTAGIFSGGKSWPSI